MAVSRWEATRITRAYLLALGALLVLQGVGSLLRHLANLRLSWLADGLLNADPAHAVIHVVWGTTMLLVTLLAADPRRVMLLALVFGVFYIGLAVLGTVVYHPLGLQLGLFENGFHWVVGPTTLGLGIWNWRAPGRVAWDLSA
jgi:hypothetical protein